MFVQVTHSKRGSKTYTTYLVRESFRTPKGPRSRTICNITALPAQLRDTIAANLRGQTTVAVDSLELHDALDYGGLAVLVDAWNRFEMDRLFVEVPSSRHRALLKAMIFSRLIFPCAKLALAQRAQGTLLAQACGLSDNESFDEDDLYEAMDEFNGRWVALEKKLYAQAFDKGVGLVLYDLTSVYFEGKGPDHMARYGYSRDHRTDRPQILLAVATDSKGVPLHVEVLRGNRADNTTLIGLLSNLRRRFGIREATFVFDGGMSSRLNLEAMDADQLRYITRLSTTSLRSLVEQLPEEKQLELGDRAKLIEVTHQDKRYVIAGGCWRQQRDFQRRELRMQKARKELERLAKIKRKKPDAQKLTSQVARALQRLKAHKYFTYQVDAKGQLQWSAKNELIEQEERLDGWYLLHTNQSQQRCDSKQTLEHYKGLLEVEEAFCQIKSYLEVRPIFHWRPDRVRNHVRLCFLAYWLSARLARQWQGCQESGEVPRILRELQTIRVGFIKLSEQSVKPMLARIPENLNKLLVKLKLLKLFNGPPRWANL